MTSWRVCSFTTCSCKNLQVEFSAKTAEIPSTFQRRFFEMGIWKFESSQVSPGSHSARDCRPTNPISARQLRLFCELAVRLYTPNLNNLGAKSPIVSGLHLKYSRFLEARARDRARSALRGVGRSLGSTTFREAEAGARSVRLANVLPRQGRPILLFE